MEKTPETIFVNAATTAPASPVTVHHWDGTSREVLMEDGAFNLGPAHLVKAVVVTSASASPDCVLSVGTIGEAKD